MRILICLFVLVSTFAHAGEQTGTVAFDIGQYQSGPNSAGMTFFMLQGPAKTSKPTCNTHLSRWVINNNWPAAKIQIAVLLAAVTSGKPVKVLGSGDCAVWGDSETAIDIILLN